ncbi:AMP-binding protein [Saccharopolyspora rosea]|uniref:AMP-binding protein n=1 Tax=Saccharopolyspora rosea TaxID=524884 RepID=A0ABW3FNU2_9PSEU
MLNLSMLLEDSARKYPDREAVVLGPTRLTYSQVNAAANQVANLLVERGIRPGDRVALSCPNLPHFPVVYYGILKTGAAVVPLNVLLKDREIAYHLDDADVKAYFCFEGTPELPLCAEGFAGFKQVDPVEHFFVITDDPAARSPIDGVETLGSALVGHGTTFDSIPTEPTDTAAILSSAPATSHDATRTASTTSSTARRTSSSGAASTCIRVRSKKSS